MTSESGAKLAVLYGHIPCRLGLCGPKDKGKKDIIEKFLKGEKILTMQVENILREFKGAYAYYKLIANANKIANPFDYRVVEAYWLGNSLLNKVRAIHLKEMMRMEFLPLGHLPEEKIKKITTGSIAHHNFHVLTIGSVTGTLKETESSLELCRVSWGKAESVGEKVIIVSLRPLKFGEKISLGSPVKKTIKWDKNILPIIKKGDWVSIHWGTAIGKLSERQVDNIEKYTKEVLQN